MRFRLLIFLWLCCAAGLQGAVAAGEVYTVDCRGGGRFPHGAGLL